MLLARSPMPRTLFCPLPLPFLHKVIMCKVIGVQPTFIYVNKTQDIPLNNSLFTWANIPILSHDHVAIDHKVNFRPMKPRIVKNVQYSTDWV